MACPSMLAMIPLQDLLDTCDSTASRNPTQDQINFPGEQEKSWRWRCALDIEDIVNNAEFVATLRELIHSSDRAVI